MTGQEALGGVSSSPPVPDTRKEAPRVAFRVVAGLALSLLTAVAAVTMMPPFGLWPLVFVAFVPMIVAQQRVLPGRLSGLAIGVGVGGLFAGQIYPGMAEAGLSWVYKAWPLYLALVVAALASGSCGFHERTAYRWLPISAPVLWVALDFLRGSGFALLGATFGNPAYALYEQPWLLQPLSVFGIWGLELLLLATNWTLAALVLVVFDRRQAASTEAARLAWTPDLRRGVLAIGGAFLGWVALSAVLLESPPPSLRVAAIQPGIASDGDEELRRDVEQTRAAATRGARLVVWRERGLPFDPRAEHTDELRGLVAEAGVHLAVGYGRREERVNEATVLAPDGRFLGTYGKDHPGEFAGDYSDTRGSYPVYDTPFGRLATIICYDLDFTDTARAMARLGAEIVAVPSNDNRALAPTHYTHLVFRAIENRLPMVKADRAWDSAIIDPWGRILERTVTPDGARATLVADVPLAPGRPLATRLGDWVGWLCVAAVAVRMTVSARARSRPRATPRPRARRAARTSTLSARPGGSPV